MQEDLPSLWEVLRNALSLGITSGSIALELYAQAGATTVFEKVVHGLTTFVLWNAAIVLCMIDGFPAARCVHPLYEALGIPPRFTAMALGGLAAWRAVAFDGSMTSFGRPVPLADAGCYVHGFWPVTALQIAVGLEAVILAMLLVNGVLALGKLVAAPKDARRWRGALLLRPDCGTGKSSAGIPIALIGCLATVLTWAVMAVTFYVRERALVMFDFPETSGVLGYGFVVTLCAAMAISGTFMYRVVSKFPLENTKNYT